jgi:hypothetical protein
MLTALTFYVITVNIPMKPMFPPSSAGSAPERIAFVTGAVSLLVCAVHLLAFPFVEEAVWAGPIGFRKPAMFGFSVGVTLLSLGWMVRSFAARPRWQTVLMGAMSGALLLEVAIISLQRFRGVPSHFNMATLLDGALWSMMGLAIIVFALLAMVQAVLSFGKVNAPPAMRAAIRAGMVLLVFSQISGQLIVLNGSNVVLEGGEFVAANISRAAIYGAAGDLKLPHAIALHGLQVLPLLALVIGRLNWRPKNGQLGVALSGAGFFGIALIAQLQAFAGRWISDLTPVMAGAFAASFAAFALPWILATSASLIQLRSRGCGAPAGRDLDDSAFHSQWPRPERPKPPTIMAT